jgi:hypothetical protein
MDGSRSVDDVEGPKALLLTQPRQELVCPLDRQGAKPTAKIELEHARDRELAQTAVRVIEEPGLFSRAAA